MKTGSTSTRSNRSWALKSSLSLKQSIELYMWRPVPVKNSIRSLSPNPNNHNKGRQHLLLLPLLLLLQELDNLAFRLHSQFPNNPPLMVRLPREQMAVYPLRHSRCVDNLRIVVVCLWLGERRRKMRTPTLFSLWALEAVFTAAAKLDSLMLPFYPQ